MKKQLPKTAIIIGGGVGGLATAALLGKAGVQVTLYEQHDAVGGRAGVFEEAGFRFDRGPSWLLMPDVFEHYFNLLGVSFEQELALQRLDPAYRVYFESGVGPLDIHGDLSKDAQTFASLEPGADTALEHYLVEAEKTYKMATSSFLYTNFDNYPAFVTPSVLKSLPAIGTAVSQTIDRYVSRFVTHPALKQLLEYHMVFLGTSPYTAPSLFRLMGYMDYRQGVFYPRGGIYALAQTLERLAKENGVAIHTNAGVAKTVVDEHNHATGIQLQSGVEIHADVVISNADLEYTEKHLLPANARSYSDRKFAKQTPSPSALLMYLGVRGALPELKHHTLLFTQDWKRNFGQMIDERQWPKPASMYICKPSETDATVAPAGHENVFVLVPGPAGDVEISDETLELLADGYIAQMAQQIGVPDLATRIVYKKLFGPRDFAERYFTPAGSMLGPANSLFQSALWRSSTKSKKVQNLYYVGATVQPGIGLPLCLISAELVYKRLIGDKSIAPLDSLRARGDA